MFGLFDIVIKGMQGIDIFTDEYYTKRDYSHVMDELEHLWYNPNSLWFDLSTSFDQE